MPKKSLSKKTDEMTDRIEQVEHDITEITGMEIMALISEIGTTTSAILSDPGKVGRNFMRLAADNPAQTRRLVAGTLVVLREVATMRKRHVKPVRDAIVPQDEVESLDEDQKMVQSYLRLLGNAVEAELNNLTGEGVHSSTGPRGYLLDIAGAVRAGRIATAEEMVGAMANSETPAVSEIGNRLLYLLETDLLDGDELFATVVLNDSTLDLSDLREHARVKTEELEDPEAFQKATDLIDLLGSELEGIHARQLANEERENDQITAAYTLDLIDAMRAEMTSETPPESGGSRTKTIVMAMLASQFPEVSDIALRILAIVGRPAKH